MMKNNISLSKFFVVCIIFAFAAGACGSGAATSTPTAATSASTTATTLHLMTWYHNVTQDMITAAANAYNERNPTLPQLTGVTDEQIDWNNYYSTLNVRLVGNRPPDVAFMHIAFKDDYIASGRLLDLKPIIDKNFPDFDWADYDQEALALYSLPVGCSWEAGSSTPCTGLYGLPISRFTWVIFYNVDAFTEAGIKTPKQMLAEGTWTWENLAAASKALVDSGAVEYGFHQVQTRWYTNGWHQMTPLWAAYGAAPWSADKKTCMFNDPAAVAATQLVWNMIYNDQSMVPPGVDITFDTGQVGMLLNRPTHGSGISKPGLNYDVVPVPAGPAGFVPTIEVNGIVVFKDSANPELAANFAISLMTKEGALEWVTWTQAPRTSILNSDAMKEGKVTLLMTPQQFIDSSMPALSSETYVADYSIPDFGAIQAASNPIFNRIWMEDADIASIMNDVCEVIQPMLPK